MVLIKKKTRRETSASSDKSPIQDEFQLKGFELMAWTGRHMKALLFAGAVVVLAVVCLLAWVWMGRATDEKASTAYHHALELLGEQTPMMKADEAKMKLAQKAFEDLAAQYSSSKVAGLALLNVGHLALELKDPKKAANVFEKYLASAPRKDKLRPLAMTGLLYAYEALGNSDKAKQLKQELADQFPTKEH